MDNKVLPDVATGIFRLRKSDRYMTSSTIVDLQDDELMALTTVEVSDGVVVLHCHDSAEAALFVDEEDEHAEEEEQEDEDEESKGDEEEADKSKEEDDDEDEDEEEEAESSISAGRTYTVASGNSVTVRAAIIRLEPVGKQTAEGSYRVQMLKPA